MHWPPEKMLRALHQLQAQERIREAQQGKGRGIVSFKAHDHQMVAVGNKLYYSRSWKTFPDFLSHYLKTKLGAAWGEAELKKPLANRHTILGWYDVICALQSTIVKSPGEVVTTLSVVRTFGAARGVN